MHEVLGRVHEVVLAMLYLRGLNRAAPVPARAWPQILSVLRVKCLSKDNVVSGLAQAGFCLESYVLQDQQLWQEAERLIGFRQVLTAASNGYPLRWPEMLGASAPPALWWNGIPTPTARAVNPSHVGCGFSIVGSRECSRRELRCVGEVAREASRLGYVVVSGGARGCDRSAVLSALAERSSRPAVSEQGNDLGADAIEILPCGIVAHARSWAGFLSKTQRDQIRERCCQLSMEPGDAEFSVSAAKERNRLIYTLSRSTFVGAARFRMGGTWDGAAQALRFRWSRILVPSELPSKLPSAPSFPVPSWNRALQALGAIVLESPSRLESVLFAPEMQGAFCYDAPAPAESPHQKAIPSIPRSA